MPGERPNLPRKLLLVRNDNIGDLICSIPAIQLLRERLPGATIHLLVNSYNAPVVECLAPKWVDRLVIYRKTKHVGLGWSQLKHLCDFYLGLKRQTYDSAVLLVGGSSPQAESFARWTGAPRVFGYGNGCEGPTLVAGRHEVEYSWDLACNLLGIQQTPPSEIAYPIRATGDRTAIQITSRKKGNRWESDRFADLARRIFESTQQRPILIWSPGDSKTATHPGDDAKAAEVLSSAADVLDPRPTATLPELISTLKECRSMVTPDGGAMHLAAAMGLRVVALFGQSEPARWRPWTPKARVMQSPSATIQDIGVEEVMGKWTEVCT